jgi:hypothetical protein
LIKWRNNAGCPPFFEIIADPTLTDAIFDDWFTTRIESISKENLAEKRKPI